MANVLFNVAKDQILGGEIDLLNDTIKVALMNSFVPNVDTDMFWDDVSANEMSGGTYVAGGATLASKACTQDNTDDEGEFDAANTTWSALLLTTPDAVIDAFIIYKDSGVPGTSPLIAFVDTASGLPLTTNGSDVSITWDAEGILNLG